MVLKSRLCAVFLVFLFLMAGCGNANLITDEQDEEGETSTFISEYFENDRKNHTGDEFNIKDSQMVGAVEDVGYAIEELRSLVKYETFISRNRAIEHLCEYGVSHETACHLVDDGEFDSDEMAVLCLEYSLNTMKTSKRQIVNAMDSYGFTEREIQYALDQSDVDWTLMAVERARIIKAGNPSVTYDELQESLKKIGFSDEQVIDALNRNVFFE